MQQHAVADVGGWVRTPLSKEKVSQYNLTKYEFLSASEYI